MIRLSVPKPCQETWAQMTAAEAGRYCLSCSKHVIDFSEMSNAESANYFLQNQDKQKEIPLWQKFLAVLLIAFSMTLFGCKTEIRPSDKISGMPVARAPSIKTEPIVLSVDTQKKNKITKGSKKKTSVINFTDQEISYTCGFTVLEKYPFPNPFQNSLLPKSLKSPYNK
jgi:hypothetical protein